jgi:hypothetical protein
VLVVSLVLRLIERRLTRTFGLTFSGVLAMRLRIGDVFFLDWFSWNRQSVIAYQPFHGAGQPIPGVALEVCREFIVGRLRVVGVLGHRVSSEVISEV